MNHEGSPEIKPAVSYLSAYCRKSVFKSSSIYDTLYILIIGGRVSLPAVLSPTNLRYNVDIAKQR